MVKIDGRKLQEVKDHYIRLAEHEISRAEQDGTELSEDDIAAIKNKHTYTAVNKLTQVLSLGPERLFKLGFGLDSNGWRAGYTKQTVTKRTQKRRTQKKIARASRQANRNK